MKSIPPLAFSMFSCVRGAVCPTYFPIKSARCVSMNTSFDDKIFSSAKIFPSIRATVVFPVPGLPIEAHMERWNIFSVFTYF